MAAGLTRREALAESLPQLYRMAAARRRRKSGWLLRCMQVLRMAVWADKADWKEVQKELIDEARE